MSRLSVLRDRRSANLAEERKQSFLVFHLGQDQFALPLLAVQKVSLLGKIFGDPQQSGISLTLQEGQELAVIDVQRRILSQVTADPSASRVPPSGNSDPQFLLIVQNSRGEAMGLPVDSKPKIQAFLEKSLKPLPAAYQSESAIQCVSALMIQDQETPIFILNPDLVSQALNPNFPRDPSFSPGLEDLGELAELEKLLTPEPVISVYPEALNRLSLPQNPVEDAQTSSQSFENTRNFEGFEGIDWENMPMADFNPEDLAIVPPVAFSEPGSPEPYSAAETLDWASLPVEDFEFPALPEDFGMDFPPVSLPQSGEREAVDLNPSNAEIPVHPVLDSELEEAPNQALNLEQFPEDSNNLDWSSFPLGDLDFFAPTSELD